MPAPRARAWVKWRDRLPEADRALRQRARSPITPRASWILPPTTGFARPATRALHADERRRGACAPRCARGAWDDVLARDRRDAARRSGRSRRGATGRRARSSPSGRADEARRALRRARRRDELLRRARRRSARRSASSRCRRAMPLEPPPARSPRSARAPTCGARSSSPSSTCAPSRSANGSTSCAASDDDALLLAAEYARRAGLYDRAINTAERTQRAPRLRRCATSTPFRTEFDGRGARPGRRRRAALRHRAAGIALRPRHRVVGRRGRPDAAHARHRALGREAARRAPTTRPARIGDVDAQHAVRRVLLQVLARPPRPACRRSRPPPTMRVRAARRRGVRAGAARRRDLGRDDPLQRNARLREEGARQRRWSTRSTLGSGRYASLTDAARRRRAAQRRRPPRVAAHDAASDGAPCRSTSLVLGGSGFVGRHVVARLVGRRASRHRADAPARDARKHLILLPTVDVVEGDVARPRDARAAASRGADARRQPRRHPERDAAARPSSACTSSCRARSSTRARPRGVRAPAAHERARRRRRCGPSQLPAQQGRGRGDRRRRPDSHWTIFRPSVIFGREDRFLNLFATLLARCCRCMRARRAGRAVPAGLRRRRRALLRARARRRRDASAQRYDLCGPKVYTLRELVALRRRGQRAPCVRSSRSGPGLSQLQARVLEHPARQAHEPRQPARRCEVDNVCDGPFPAVFGIAPTALEAVAPLVSRARSASAQPLRPVPRAQRPLTAVAMRAAAARSRFAVYRVGGSVRDELLGRAGRPIATASSSAPRPR